MGKGKKRDKDKKEVDQLAKDTVPLSISDSQPSTSSASVPAPPVEEESAGLGLGLSSKSRKKKQKAAATERIETPQPMSVASSPAHTAATAEVAPVQQEQVKQVQQVQEESDGLGLGLSKGKSRSRNKNKGAKQAQPPPDATASVAGPSAPVPQPSSLPASSAPLPGPSVPQSAPGIPYGDRRGQPSAWGTGPQTPQSTALPSGSTKSETWQPTPSQAPGQSAGRGRGRGTVPPVSGGDTPQSGPSRELSSRSVPGVKPTAAHQPIQSAPMSLRQIPQRIPSVSQNARRQQVLTNYLPMKIKAQKIHRYDVSFAPDRPKKFLAKAFQLAKSKLYPKHVLAFDQIKNCYSLKPLPDVTGATRVAETVEVPDGIDRILKIEVSFKYTGVVDLGTILQYMKSGTSLSPPTEAIQCVDVILKQGTLESYVKAGRQYFLRPQRPKDLGDGLEMWTGLFQSAIFTSQPFVNIDVAHKGFPRQQPLLQAISQDFRLELNRPIDMQRGRGVENFLDFIKGLRVVAQIIGTNPVKTREFMCNGLAETPDKQMFTYTDMETNKSHTISVGEYFRKTKGYRIQYPSMNCMWVGPRDKGIYFPMELLEVSYGQARSKQLNERQLSTMVREAATPPDIRKQKIEEVIQKMKYSANPYFQHFGLEITENFFRVEAKVLEPPNLDVGQARSIIPRKGVWQTNTLLKPEALMTWGFIAIDLNPGESNSEGIVKLLKDIGHQMGMQVGEPMMRQFNVRIESLRAILINAVEKGITFLFIVISKRGRDTYQRVKQLAECQVGILTQCIKEATAATRMNTQTIRNILLKVNSKLMGINQTISGYSTPPCLKGGDVMVIGADVTHPSPDQKNIPSIAAVTASLDTKCFVYNIELSVQTPKQEMIVQFEDMMVDHLKLYRERQGKLPKKLFIFRDGVSEGQFAQVMQSELTATHRAYQKMAGANAPKPEVLFLLVQKRHHTRFFMPEGKTQYNVDPGTVVDTHIVHPHELDFYLVSHAAIKGTARPTRYHAVCNDGRIPDGEVEQLTYYLCHLYSRCMRAVSYPTPTYYAHLACLRARSLTYGQTFINQELEVNPRRLRVLDRMLKHSRMFFV